MSTQTIHQVLWTSGWDSTFRVLDLILNHGEVVQPWYVIDEHRRSSKIELKTMREIRANVAEFNPVVATRLLPLIVRKRWEIPSDPEIELKFTQLQSIDYFGSQYKWLADLALSEGLTLEIGLKSDDRPSVHLSGHVRRINDGGVYAIDTCTRHLDFSIFDNFRFPLFDMTKLDMKAVAENSGFSSILHKTWFCHSPLIGGRVCGICPPCSHAREEGFAYRVPSATRWRRVEFEFLKKVAAVKRRATFGH